MLFFSRDEGTVIKTSVLSYGALKLRNVIFPSNVVTAKRHYRQHDIAASYLPPHSITVKLSLSPR